MWYILNYIPSPGKRRSSLPNVVAAYNAGRDAEPLEVFAPLFIAVEMENGKVRKTARPLLYHYVFMRGEEENVKEFCHTYEGFSFVMDRTSTEKKHLTLTDAQVRQFSMIASYYGNRLPCYPTEGLNLQEGDKVQVVSGPFAGLTGTFLTRKGAKTGNILISVAQNLAAVVYDVKADYVRVLEFSRDSRRLYDQLDAFTHRLLQNPEPATPNSAPNMTLVASATVFVRRLGETRVSNPKTEARLLLLLYAAYRILGDKNKAEETLKKYHILSTHITNPWTKALSYWLQGNHKVAQTLVTTLPQTKLSALQRTLLNRITQQ